MITPYNPLIGRMYIEIAEDIIGIMHDPNHKDYKTIVWFLHEIALSMKRGKHYISIPSLRKDVILKDKLRKALPNIFGLISQADDSDSRELKKSVDWHMVVTKDIPDPKKDKVIYFNPIHNDTFEIFEEAHLICENLYDCEFYGLILIAFDKGNRKPGIQHKYLSRNGGGATTATVVEKEILNSNHLCLIITDSDRKYRSTPFPDPNKNPERFGDTFRSVDDKIRALPYEFMYHHVLGNTREIENLIPHSILFKHLQKCNKNTEKLIKQCDTSFFDFKEGLQYSDLNVEAEFLYWKPIMDTLKIDYSKRKKFKEEAKKKKKKYYKLVEAESPLIPGFGNSILPTVIEKNRKDLSKQDFKQLTEDQRNDWQEIGKLLHSWTLAKTYR